MIGSAIVTGGIGVLQSRLIAILIAVVVTWPHLARADEAAVSLGEYIFNAADCVGCHTDAKNGGKPLVGGRPLTTPFGTFYSPNITPDKKTGIGNWSLDEFRQALYRGISPGGSYYF